MSEDTHAKKVSPSAHIPKVTNEADPGFLYKAVKNLFFDMVVLFGNIVCYIFFREITVRGSFNLPKTGPAIVVVAPHANQFVDGAIIMTQLRRLTNRNSPPIIAESSYKKNKVVGTLAKLANAIPVPRAQDNLKYAQGEIYLKEDDTEGTHIYGRRTKFTQLEAKGLIGLPESAGSADIAEIVSDTELVIRKPFKSDKAKRLLLEGTRFKYAAKISNEQTFQHVFNRLHNGGLINIFPEGGSHDRPDLLPIKAGFAIMALGAVAADPTCSIQIVPTGLNYFHRNEFRSRAVVEFGTPIRITAEDGEFYKTNPRAAVSKLLDEITEALKSVTLTAPDFDTLMVCQAARRLYANKIPVSLAVDMNRKLITGYTHYKDDPRIVSLKSDVLEYQKRCNQLGLRDHQVEIAVRDRWRSALILASRVFRMTFLMLLSLPGSILFAPIFIVTDRISRQKQKEALAASMVKVKAIDVVASWKIIVATVFAPALYVTYSVIGTILAMRYDILGLGSWTVLLVFPTIYLGLVFTTYAAFRTGEVGYDVLKSLPPLISSVFANRDELQQLKEFRGRLALEITEVVNLLGPKVFPDFDKLNERKNREESRGRKEAEDEDHETIRSRSLSIASTVSNALSRVNSWANLSDIPILGDGGYTNDSSYSSTSELESVKKADGSTGSNADSSFLETSTKLRKAMEKNMRDNIEQE
ncbi:hypothetical protein WICPIJ_002049 [Wickerhamomyces pijperi]|uniref:Phospholipid/glycerol acyltransferase domain-containing protein n=1 Tax=Wickerhamomyces pijperi TaxID=599730 RepID=A0A9P8QAE4_WICPI|nr:hypothetical protein WICPIJ_002049 [Wickerhamomyces pijperi]